VEVDGDCNESEEEEGPLTVLEEVMLVLPQFSEAHVLWAIAALSGKSGQQHKQQPWGLAVVRLLLDQPFDFASQHMPTLPSATSAAARACAAGGASGGRDGQRSGGDSIEGFRSAAVAVVDTQPPPSADTLPPNPTGAGRKEALPTRVAKFDGVLRRKGDNLEDEGRGGMQQLERLRPGDQLIVEGLDASIGAVIFRHVPAAPGGAVVVRQFPTAAPTAWRPTLQRHMK